MKRAEKARELFIEGYTCSQAVAMAFCDLTKVSLDEMKKISLPLGGGLGRLRLTCGAVSAMALIIGSVFSSDENTDENKIKLYGIIQLLVERFKKEKKTIICEELLNNAAVEVEVGGTPEERNSGYYKKRPCAQIVYLAGKVLEEYLEEQHII